MKKCGYCFKDLQLGVDSPIHCMKCVANEKKYGKPDVCKYCQLPAAFRDAMCVHCCHAERKHGAPTACSKCQLRCAFPKDSNMKSKPVLCRLCTIVHGSGSSLPEAAAPASGPTTSEPPPTKKANLAGGPSAATPGSIDSFMLGEQMYSAHQQLKDKIVELNRLIGQKDRTLLEKDQRIAELSAEILRKDKDHRARLLQMEKQHVELSQSLQEQIRDLFKQVQKAQKPSTAS